MPKNPFSSGGAKGYKSKQAPEYEKGAYDLIGQRAGGTKHWDPKQKAYVYDFSGTMNPIRGAEGIARSTEGYDFNPTDTAISGLRSPSQYQQAYNPATMSFKGLPGLYRQQAYERGAGDIRREGAGALEKLRENVGVRRPGILAKLGEDNQRQTDERLDELGTALGLKEMEQNTDLGVQEQMANADEQYKGYQSRADREARQADERYRYLQGLNEVGQGKIATQSGLMENERANQDKVIDYLMSLFSTAAGATNQGAQVAANNRSSTLGFLGSIL